MATETMTIVAPPAAKPVDAADQKYTIYVYGKYQDPIFQSLRVAAESLANDRCNIEAAVEGYFESQYEQQLKFIISKYGGSFAQSKPSAPLVFAESEDSVLYFANEKRFFEWATKRFQYEDNTRLIFYKRVGNKALQAVKEKTGRSYCTIAFAIDDDPQEAVQLELFDEECPETAKNFLDLMNNAKFDGHLVHRIKPGGWVQAGDLADGSGLNSQAANGSIVPNESFQIAHDRPGLLGMANHGTDTNGSQFYITMRELPFLDGKSVIFGRVIGGMRTILKIGKLQTRNERPVKEVKVHAKLDATTPGALQKEREAAKPAS
eukprot:TRINITY_DN103839_c0_g1_i1.p1 TRINITY_DN103839_c0_g1~~TRINITY_DN103839_c0_g1_i1.p1  ORF type:complete len:320 (-),score=98.88 TRINITY_DN103839_c0_g1_i1:160-1119(-)